jgi:hypothetical protein
MIYPSKYSQGKMSPSLGPQAAENLQLVLLRLIFADPGSLLLRFYDPTSGKITLNGVDVREYSVKQVDLPYSVTESSSDDISQSYHRNLCCIPGLLLRILLMVLRMQHNRQYLPLLDVLIVISSETSLMDWRRRLALEVHNFQVVRNR